MEIICVNVSQPTYVGKLTHKSLKITGIVDLSVLSELKRYEYDFLDISEAEFGMDEEESWTCLGWSHSGPVERFNGYKKIEVLRRFLEQINAKTILLPDNVQRRHVNSAKQNEYVKELAVKPTCSLFSSVDGKLMNKKKTMVVFG